MDEDSLDRVRKGLLPAFPCPKCGWYNEKMENCNDLWHAPLILKKVYEALDRAANAVNAGGMNFADIFESFRNFERTIGLACPTCGHQDLDAGIWDDAGLPEAMCQNLFHGVNRWQGE